MRKTFLFSLVAALLLGNMVMLPAQAATAVCGVDGNTYASADAAAAAEVDVSYEGACTVVTSEDQLDEATTPVNFVGVLIEIGTTELPTTIIVEDNGTHTHYTIEAATSTSILPVDLSQWIPGDQVRVVGSLNENTETVTATTLTNLSFSATQYDGFNGWITSINATSSSFVYTWQDQEHTVTVTDRTRIVAGLKNPAVLADLKVGDRVRGRLFENRTEAKIVVVLRRGSDLFMKIRTFVPNATLVRLSSTVVPTTIQVEISATPGLKANDVNNLIGTAGTLVTVNVTEDTVLTRKYFGRTTLAEFSPGDELRIVGRVNDDGTIDAKLIKNNSIWQTNVFGHVGVVQSVNTDGSYLVMNWQPLHYTRRAEIKEKVKAHQHKDLSAQLQGRFSQSVTTNDLADRLRERARKLFDRVQSKLQQTRERIVKKIESDRIDRPGLRLSDVVSVSPAREIRVNVTADTTIRIGENENATLADIKADDRILVAGVRHAGDQAIDARKIVVLPSLPEIDDDPSTLLDDVNCVVEQLLSSTDVDSTTEVEVEVQQ